MEVKSTYMSLGDYGRAQQYSSIRQLPLYPDTETNKPKKQVKNMFKKKIKFKLREYFAIYSKQKCTISVLEALK